MPDSDRWPETTELDAERHRRDSAPREPEPPLADRRQPSPRRRGDRDTGRWDHTERERFKRDLTTTIQSDIEELHRKTDLYIAGQQAKAAESDAIRAEADAQKAAAEVESEKARTKREKLLNRMVIALTAAITGFGSYFATRDPPEKAVVEQRTQEVKAAVEQTNIALEAAKKAEGARIDTIEDRQLRLGMHAVESDIVQSVRHDDVLKKLDAMSSRARDVEESPIVEDARKKAEAIRKRKLLAEQRGEVYDPFPDLPEPPR